MLLLHIGGHGSAFIFIFVDLGFFSFASVQVPLTYSLRLILAITKKGPWASTQVCFDLAESQRNTSMAELQQPIDFIYLTKGYRVQPIVPYFAREHHQATWLEVEINNSIIWVLKMHSGTAF